MPERWLNSRLPLGRPDPLHGPPWIEWRGPAKSKPFSRLNSPSLNADARDLYHSEACFSKSHRPISKSHTPPRCFLLPFVEQSHIATGGRCLRVFATVRTGDMEVRLGFPPDQGITLGSLDWDAHENPEINYDITRLVGTRLLSPRRTRVYVIFPRYRTLPTDWRFSDPVPLVTRSPPVTSNRCVWSD